MINTDFTYFKVLCLCLQDHDMMTKFVYYLIYLLNTYELHLSLRKWFILAVSSSQIVVLRLHQSTFNLRWGLKLFKKIAKNNSLWALLSLSFVVVKYSYTEND